MGGANNAGGDDDYVPVHMSGHKPQKPSYPGEINFVKEFTGFKISFMATKLKSAQILTFINRETIFLFI